MLNGVWSYLSELRQLHAASLATPVIGAMIGYCTNWLAIRMLYRPYRPENIFGIHNPFTPGLIPKEQARLAKKVAEAVGNHIITPELLSQKLISPSLLLTGANEFKSAIRKNLPKGAAYIQQFENSNLDAQGAELVKTLIKENVGRFSGMFLNPDKIYAGIKEGVFDYLSQEKNLDVIADKIDEWIDQLCTLEIEEEKKAPIIDAFEKIADHVARHINIEYMIEEQINTFDPEEAEALILSVIKRELHVVLSLGGILGLL